MEGSMLGVQIHLVAILSGPHRTGERWTLRSEADPHAKSLLMIWDGVHVGARQNAKPG
jgi:hypothetical protein